MRSAPDDLPLQPTFVPLIEHRRCVDNAWVWGFACGVLVAAAIAFCGALIASHPWL